MSSKVVRAEGSGCNKGTFMISLGFPGGGGKGVCIFCICAMEPSRIILVIVQASTSGTLKPKPLNH